MDFSPYCGYFLDPNGCVGCNCMDEVGVFIPYCSPAYYSSSFVGEGRSGNLRPTTSSHILLVAHYRYVEPSGPVVVLTTVCIWDPAVVLLPYFYHWTCLSYQVRDDLEPFFFCYGGLY